MAQKTWTEKEIVALLERSDAAVARGLVAIYNRQTGTEQIGQRTIHRNNIGFSASDAAKGSRFAKYVLAGYRIEAARIGQARALALKYRRQLLAIANARAGEAPA